MKIVRMGMVFFHDTIWATKKKPDSLEYIGDYTIQLYGDYNKPWNKDPVIKQPFHGKSPWPLVFFPRHHDFPSSFLTENTEACSSHIHLICFGLTLLHDRTTYTSEEFWMNMKYESKFFDAHRNHQNLPQGFGKSYPMVFKNHYFHQSLEVCFCWKSWRVGHFLMSPSGSVAGDPCGGLCSVYIQLTVHFTADGLERLLSLVDQKIWGALCS